VLLLLSFSLLFTSIQSSLIQYAGHYTTNELSSVASYDNYSFERKCNRGGLLQIRTNVNYQLTSYPYNITERDEVIVIDTETYPQKFYIIRNGEQVLRRFKHGEYEEYDGKIPSLTCNNRIKFIMDSEFHSLHVNSNSDKVQIGYSDHSDSLFEAIEHPDRKSFLLKHVATGKCIDTNYQLGNTSICDSSKDSQKFKWNGVSIVTMVNDELKWLCPTTTGTVRLTDSWKYKCHYSINYVDSEDNIIDASWYDQREVIVSDQVLQRTLRSAYYPFEYNLAKNSSSWKILLSKLFGLLNITLLLF
jgi:hypothetical protein